MTKAAKVKIQTRDRSAIITTLDGIAIGTVVDAKWGSTKPKHVSNSIIARQEYGDRYDASKGVSYLGLLSLIGQSDNIWVTRAIGEHSRHSAILARTEAPQVLNTTGYNTSVIPALNPIVGGIALEGLSSYTFPEYPATRTYEDTTRTVLSASGSTVIVNGGLTWGTNKKFKAGDEISFGATVDNTSNLYKIVTAATVTNQNHTLTLTTNIPAAANGVEVLHYAGNDLTQAPVSYPTPVFVKGTFSATNQIQVDDSDLIGDGDIIVLADAVPTTGSATAANTYIVQVKSVASMDEYQLVLNIPVTGVNPNDKIWLQLTGDTVYKDSILIIGKYVGDYGDRIKVSIGANTEFDKSFVINVYFDGNLAETFLVSKNHQLDGFGNQMYVEDRVNGNSLYIEVKDNTKLQDVPVATDHGIWLRDPDDIFSATTISTVETVLKGDEEIKLSTHTGLSIGQRIKLAANTNEEYKILTKSNDGTHDTITIDRPTLQGYTTNSTIFSFDPAFSNPANNIHNGQQWYNYSEIGVQLEKKIGDKLKVGTNLGTIKDAGANNLAGGDDGTPITDANVVAAFNKMASRDLYRVNAFCDNGFAFPSVAIAIDAICKNTQIAHGFLSTPRANELAADTVQANINYVSGFSLNSEYVSIFSDWIKVTEPDSGTKVLLPPATTAVNAQSFVTRDYEIFTPAAGWVFGRVNSESIQNVYTQSQLDRLVENNINPMKYRHGLGLAIWGNVTRLAKTSPLQDRSVAMLLIVLRTGLIDYLDFELFQKHNEETYLRLETAISTFIRTRLLDTGGIEEGFEVRVKDIVTTQDKDNNHIPIFIGIKPTSYVNTITASINVFNHSLEITL